jgi:hypothetical protein
MIKITRWAVTMAGAAALLILLAAAARGGDPGQPLVRATPVPSVRDYRGWISIDVISDWSQPNPLGGEEFESFIIPRIRGYLHLGFNEGEQGPPSGMIILFPLYSYWAHYGLSVEHVGIPNACRGYDVTSEGVGEVQLYSGSPSGDAGRWTIMNPGLSFLPILASSANIQFLGGDCEGARSGLQQGDKAGIEGIVLPLGQVEWSFQRGSQTPGMIEGTCTPDPNAALNLTVQCHWEVFGSAAATAPLTPPRRR